MTGTALTDPERWEDGEFEWEPRTCYTVPLLCPLGRPVKLPESVQRLRAEVETKGYPVPDDGMLLMEIGPLKGRLLLPIVPPEMYDASVIELEKSLVFSMVHYGPLKTIGNTAKRLKEKVRREKGVPPTNTYYWDFRHGSELSGQRADRFVVFCRV